MKITFAIIIVGIMFLLIAGCSGTSNPVGPNTSSAPKTMTNTVIIKSFAFSPVVDTVSQGTTITWKNNDGVAHTSTSDNGVWDTGSIPSGGSETTVFNTVGSFPYHCTIHPSMTGIVIVK